MEINAIQKTTTQVVVEVRPSEVFQNLRHQLLRNAHLRHDVYHHDGKLYYGSGNLGIDEGKEVGLVTQGQIEIVKALDLLEPLVKELK